MSTHKYIDRICAVGLACALLLTLLLMNGDALGIQSTGRIMGYEDRLFDTSRVHTVDIVMDDWDSFIASCRNEEYSACSVVIDGEAYKNVGIRGKGNTSLSTVSSMNSERYSFKIEFDQYDNTKTYHGLDKLCLNNIIQDTTYMKDYLTYRMMGEFGAAAPLCSYVWITVNGEPWGLYLAVEAVEESFLQRNYGADYGDLYKPDSMNFGGGRGNGKDFNMEDFMAGRSDSAGNDAASGSPDSGMGNFDPSAMFGGNMPAMPGGNTGTTRPSDGNTGDTGSDKSQTGRFDFGGMMGGFGGMGGSDVKLQYAGDDPGSYSNIFSSAKTAVTAADETRLIAALKALSEGDAENSVDIDAVLRYFVVHNFAVNGDSYTGSMIHNYYLYEKDGLLAMLPWDYNLAYGTFQGGNAESAVNDPIDTPLSVTGSGDRPMADWIFSNEAYTEQYHQYFAEFLQTVDITGIIDEAAALIAPYVEKDPTAFYTYEEFLTGSATLREFCVLRTESIQGQLNGTVPSTDEGQRANDAVLVETGSLNLSSMGSMGGGMGGGFGGNRGENDKTQRPDASGSTGENSGSTERPDTGSTGQWPNMTRPDGGNTGTTMPDGFSGMTPPDGTTIPDGFSGMTPPDGTTIPDGASGIMPTRPQTGGTAGGQQSGGNTGTPRPSGGNAMGGMPNFGGMGGDFTGGNRGGNTGGSRVPGQSGSMPNGISAASGGDLILWIVTAAVLAGSLLFAKFYRRRTR